MPSITVDVRMSYTPDEEVAILEAVYAALVEAFGVLPSHRNLLLVSHPPHRFLGRPDGEQPDRLTNISLFVLPGRSIEAKRTLYRRIVENLEPLGIPRGCVLIRLHEIPPANIAVRGGEAVCDIELGYPVRV
jgi:hypothetical protein